MTVEDIMFALTISITIGMIIWSWVMASFMDKTSKALKEIQDNQFDAEQVMKLYSMKFSRPISTEQIRADAIDECIKAINDLNFEYAYPHTVCNILEMLKEKNK